MQTTSNFGFKKPEQTDFYNVEDFNENADKIDEQLKKQSEATGVSAEDKFGIGFSNIQELIDIISQKVVDELLTKEDVINHLASNETDLPLSANQGKVLSEKVGAVKIYVGADEKLHFTDSEGADTALPFKRAQGNATESCVLSPYTFTNADGVLLTGTYTLAGATNATAAAKDLLKGKTAYVNGQKLTGTCVQNPNAMDTVLKGGVSSNGYGYTPEFSPATSSFSISCNKEGYSSQDAEVYSNRNYILDEYSKLTIRLSHLYMPSGRSLKVYLSKSTSIDAGSGDYSAQYLGELSSVNTDIVFNNISGVNGVWHIVFVSPIGRDIDSNKTQIKYTVSKLEFS